MLGSFLQLCMTQPCALEEDIAALYRGGPQFPPLYNGFVLAEFVLGPLAREKCISRGLVRTVPTAGQICVS